MLADAAGVKTLVLFHHDPDHDDTIMDRIAADLDRLFVLWRDDATFRAFVADPRLDAAAQQRGAFGILDRAGVGTEVRNLVGVLINNRRLSALPQVAQAFGAQLATRRGQQTAHVTSAHPLSDTQRAQIAARLTDVPTDTVEALIDSLKHDMVAADDDFVRELLPAGHRLVGLEESIRRALVEKDPDVDPATADPMGPLPQDPDWAEGGSGVVSRITGAIDALQKRLS